MIQILLKVTVGLSGTIYKIERIVEKDDKNDIEKLKCKVGEREYVVGQHIIDENLYRLKIPGVMLNYTR